ncbi:MAG: GntR family transcriptional regulator [Desulfobacula sp.]|nr:GntR family transcriptional regulator [Desulfobacula sp.]
MTSSQKNNFERVLEILEYKIISGILKPRERLIERELTEEYKITTGTVRNILKELTVKNLINHMSNRGAVVAEPTPKEVEDIYHTRVLLESYAIGFVVANMDKIQLKKVVAHETAFEKYSKEKNLRGILNHNRLFHQSMFEVCGNQIASDLIDQLRNRSRIWYHYIRGNAQHRENSIKDHLSMIDCLGSKDASKLKEINTRHLTVGYTNYIEQLTAI